MKSSSYKSIGLALVLSATVSGVQADVTLFQDDFESGLLDQWVGKDGGPHSGLIVPDPLNPANNVLTLTAVTFGGDMFTAMPLNVSRVRQYVLSFDFLGYGGEINGGFVGFGPVPSVTPDQVWVGGTYLSALNAPAGVATILVADGEWHHYDIDFTEVVEANGLSETLLMLEDWVGQSPIAGNAFFDNLKVVGVFDVTPIALEVLGQVPCEGPEPGKAWRNHGQYVSMVSKLADTYVYANILAPEEVKEITDIAAESDCGKKK